MNKKLIKLTESDLHRIVSESVKRMLSEAEDGGWIVDESEAQEAYNLAVEVMGEETINKAIVETLSNNQLAECLAFIFRMYDFREWQSKYN